MANEPSYGPSADWLRVFEETQRQTAEAHQVFQRTMAETHRAFLEAMTGGLERSVAPSAAPSLPAHVNGAGNGHARLLGPGQMTLAPRVASSQPSANGNGHADAHVQVPAIVARPAPVATTAVARPAPVPQPAPVVAKAAAPVAVKPGVDLRATLFAIVAEKTGYPVEALGPTMDLEGDLGIDSIKRVEILSALREKAPGLPEVSADSLGKLRTLEQIASFLGDHGPKAVAAAPVAVASVAVASVAPPAKAAASALNLETILKEVVAEKTGYPVEALRPELDLESDLGIDSIKRVEILSRMRERAPGLPEVSMETMAKLRTLGQIAAQLGGDAKPAPATQPAVVSTLPNLGRWSVESINTPALGLAQPLVKRAAMVGITDDGTGVRAALIVALQKRGVAAQAADGKLDASVVLDLAGLGEVEDLLAFQKAALMRAKAFSASGVEGRAYHLIFDAGGDLGASGHDLARAGIGGLTGLAKTAALEWPKSLVRAIDVARGGRSASELAEIIADEVLFGGPEVEVGLAADGRRTRLVSKKSATGLPPTGAPRLGDKSVHVISGGGRGVTRAIAQGLAERHRGRFVLLGRTPLGVEAEGLAKAKTERELMGLLASVNAGTPPLELKKKAAAVLAAREIRDTLKALEAKGASAQYLAVDVRDAGALAKALDQVRQSWGPIHSVIHAAGVIEDRMIGDKTEAQADRVLGTKIEGLSALLAATAGDPLSVIALFGSISGRTGNVGQSDYAMANETLVKIARAEKARRGAACVVKAIAWGPWQGGMVTPAHEELFKQRGVPLIDLDSGSRLFLEELERPDGVEVVIGCSPVSHQPIAIDFVIDEKTHGYLTSHSIKGVPVVPVMLAMEWFVRAARVYKPELELARLSNLKVMRGARIEKLREGHALSVVVKELANGGPESTLGLELRGPAGELHYSAEATMSPLLPTPAPSPGSPKVDAWGTRSIYGGVLFHGPSFQAIRSVRGVSEDGGEATLAGMGQLGWPGDPAWRTDCAMLDGGLQLALLWSERVLGRASLPTSIKSVRLFHGAFDGDVRCLLKGKGHQAERASSDLVFVGADGRIVAELEGVETHALPSDA